MLAGIETHKGGLAVAVTERSSAAWCNRLRSLRPTKCAFAAGKFSRSVTKFTQQLRHPTPVNNTEARPQARPDRRPKVGHRTHAPAMAATGPAARPRSSHGRLTKDLGKPELG